MKRLRWQQWFLVIFFTGLSVLCTATAWSESSLPHNSAGSAGGGVANPGRAEQPDVGSIEIPIPLTLDRAVAIAVNNNPEIAATGWDVEVAEQRRRLSAAAGQPILSLEGGIQRYLDDQRLVPARFNGEVGFFDETISRADLVLRMTLYSGGRITNEIGSNELLRLAEEKRLAFSRQELAFNVTSTFYAILSQREVIRSLQFSQQVLTEHRNMVSDQLAVQKAAPIDLLRTEVRLADLGQSLVREENVQAVQHQVLLSLLGIDGGDERLEIAGDLNPPLPTDSDVAELVSLALQQRGDYLAAQDRVAAMEKRVAAARAGFLPSLSLTASYGARIAGVSDSARIAGVDEQEDTGSIGIGLSVPLFDGGRAAAAVGLERAGWEAARSRLRQRALQIRREVKTAALAIQSGHKRVETTEQAIDQAQESLRIQRMKFELGSGSLTDLLDAQSALLQSETNYVRAVADVHIATAQLRFVTGENVL